MRLPANILRSILREDFKSFGIKTFKELHPGRKFINGWHIDLICDELQCLTEDNYNKLIINIPPRYLKSIMCSVALPAYILGKMPHAKVMCISYGEDLALELARKCLTVMASNWYKKLFPGTIIQNNRNSAIDFETTKRGGKFSTTMGGVITGSGADYIIIDDPLKPDDATSDTMREKVNKLYRNTIHSRLNDQNTGKIILVMQRLHENDLTGYLLATDKSFKHIKLPLIAE